MARFTAHRGNRLHAPENSVAALVSAYTSGAALLEFDVSFSVDGVAVVAAPDAPRRMAELDEDLRDLRWSAIRGLDAGATFSVVGGTATPWRRRADAEPPLARFDRLTTIIGKLPPDADLAITVHGRDDDDTVERCTEVARIIRDSTHRGVVYLAVGSVRTISTLRVQLPDVKAALIVTRADLDEWIGAAPDLIVAPLTLLVGPSAGGSTVLLDIEAARNRGELLCDVIAFVDSADGVPADADIRSAASAFAFPSVPDWLLFSTPSMLRLEAISGLWRLLDDESFEGETERADRYHFGHAKANPYAHIHQHNGVHVEIAEYDGEWPVEPVISDDPVTRRLDELEWASWDAGRNWPFYSGGGVGTAYPIEGDFIAEVDARSATAVQATMCEMAIVNADPPKHRPGWIVDDAGNRTPNLPKSFRDKSTFFDPHGAPPFVGSEHDEDDGYRINWNLDSDYDSNQYGRPVGNGTTLDASLRLERRGPYLASCYRDTENADWVVSGVCRNDSMNIRVFLRVAGKRWRQERDENHPGPGVYMPVPANHFTFRNLSVRIRALRD